MFSSFSACSCDFRSFSIVTSSSRTQVRRTARIARVEGPCMTVDQRIDQYANMARTAQASTHIRRSGRMAGERRVTLQLGDGALVLLEDLLEVSLLRHAHVAKLPQRVRQTL